MATNDREFEREKSRKGARNFGAIVYVGGVVAATVLFITFALTAFPADAYFSRFIMTLAGCAVGVSMIAFPVAMHSWVVTKEHRFWGTILYYGEMFIIAINTVVSFTTLYSKNTGAVIPPWILQYEPYSVAALVYSVFAWGTLLLIDPQHKELAEEKDEETELRREVAKLRFESLKTPEGRARIQAMADAEIAQRYTVGNYLKRKGLDETDVPTPVSGTPFEKKQSVAPRVQMQCLECGKDSGENLFCCPEHDLAHSERSLAQAKSRIDTLKRGQPPL